VQTREDALKACEDALKAREDALKDHEASHPAKKVIWQWNL